MKRILSKRSAILEILLGASVSLIGWSQNWVSFTLASADIRVTALDVSGQATSALPAGLALVSIATGLVLLTSRALLAYVIAAVNAAAAVSLVLVCLAVISDPMSFVFKQLQALSGIADENALRLLVTSSTLGAGVFVCAAGGVFVLLGVASIASSAHTWPSRRSRFERSPATAHAPEGRGAVETLDAWDEMSRGTDPTS